MSHRWTDILKTRAQYILAISIRNIKQILAKRSNLPYFKEFGGKHTIEIYDWFHTKTVTSDLAFFSASHLTACHYFFRLGYFRHCFYDMVRIHETEQWWGKGTEPWVKGEHRMTSPDLVSLCMVMTVYALNAWIFQLLNYPLTYQPSKQSVSVSMYLSLHPSVYPLFHKLIHPSV
jgi:hypothetical protein